MKNTLIILGIIGLAVIVYFAAVTDTGVAPPPDKKIQVGPVTFHGGQASIDSSAQVASIGTVNKKKRLTEGGKIINFIISPVHAQIVELTRLVAYIGSQFPGFFLDGQIFTYDFSTAQKIKLTSSPSSKSRPVVSEATNKVAFYTDDNGPSQASPNGIKVEIIDLLSNTSETVTTRASGYGGLVFSHDSTKLLYHNVDNALVIYDVNKKTKTPLAFEVSPGESRFFSSDDSKLYFAGDQATTLYELNLADNKLRAVFRLPQETLDLISVPSISEDGSEIYFFRIKRKRHVSPPGEEGGEGPAEIGYEFVRLTKDGQVLKSIPMEVKQERGLSYLISRERNVFYYTIDGKLLEINLVNGNKKILDSSIGLNEVLGFGTSKDSIIVMKFAGFPLIGFYDYDLNSGKIVKVFDNS